MEQSICIFGASTTQGFYDEEKGGWADRLKEYLFKKNNDKNYFEVFNLGISGNTTRDLLIRFENEAKQRRPTIIIISIGDNDSALHIELPEFQENMIKIIQQAKSLSKSIILLGCKKVNEKLTNPVPWQQDVSYSNKKIKEFDNKLEEIAKNQNVNYIKIFDLLNDKDLFDGLHPNPAGHEKIFQAVKSFLEEKKLI